MRLQARFFLVVAALLVGFVVSASLATAQYAPAVDPRYGGYYDGDYGYYEYDWRSPETGVERVLGDPGAEWDYEPLGDEWEIESVYGEVDYEPEGYFEPASREELEQAIRAELQGPGAWEYEPLQGEWEYETPAGDEIEYEPGARPAVYDDDWYYDYGDYGTRSPETGVQRRSPEADVQRVLGDPYAEWDYHPLTDEWEIESIYGEVDYEPEGDLEPASREELEQAIRAELHGPGTWEYEPLQGEWEYETPAGDDIEYEPSPRY